MDLEKVREFSAFATSLKFTETAQRLHMSQSSLSKHIRDLEDEIGALLVVRGTNGGRNALTPAGRRFLERTGPWLAEYDAIATECRELAAAVPPARIQDMHCSLNINSQLRLALKTQGVPIGNFAYVSVYRPIREALDHGIVDFAVHCEPCPQMRAYAAPDLARDYGWIALTPEPLCVLAGTANPCASEASISLDELGRAPIITIENAAYCNWPEATSEAFAARGCTLAFKAVHDSPLEGGAIPVGPHDLVLCTRRFARYYEDLDVEDVCELDIRGFEPIIYPFLVYRHDTSSVVARQVIEAMG